MIETREQWEKMFEEIPTITDIQDVRETIEALREVAKAARGMAARGYAQPNIHWREAVWVWNEYGSVPKMPIFHPVSG